MPLDLAREIIARWPDPDPSHVSLLREGGVTAVLASGPTESFARACREAGLNLLGANDVRFAALAELERSPADAPVALTDGLWAGVTRGPNAPGRGDETASASREPWVDANSFWVAYLRALYPKRPALLGHSPPADRMVPFDSLELALIDAWVAGGNCLLPVERRFREALLRGDAKALDAWKQLGRTTRWLRENRPVFEQPTMPRVTLLVEPGAETAEIANLMFRRNGSPALAPAGDPPPPDPARIPVLVAVELKTPSPATWKRIYAHAEAGATVIANSFKDPRRKPVRIQEDRDFYKLGRGQVVNYRETISDPSEFALDVIDLVTHPRRAVRLWNAPSVIARATTAPGATLVMVNYGSPLQREFPARIQGHFARARLLRPEAAAVELPTARRGSTTEVRLERMQKLAVAVFS